MRFFHAKFYDNNKLTLISVCLYNLKWLSVFVILINILPVLERGTSTGLDHETAFWGTVIVIGTLSLFVLNKNGKSCMTSLQTIWLKYWKCKIQSIRF